MDRKRAKEIMNKLVYLRSEEPENINENNLRGTIANLERFIKISSMNRYDRQNAIAELNLLKELWQTLGFEG